MMPSKSSRDGVEAVGPFGRIERADEIGQQFGGNRQFLAEMGLEQVAVESGVELAELPGAECRRGRVGAWPRRPPPRAAFRKLMMPRSSQTRMKTRRSIRRCVASASSAAPWRVSASRKRPRFSRWISRAKTEPVILKVLQEDLVDGLRPAEVEEHAVETANPPAGADPLDLGQQPLQRAAGDRLAAERLPEHVPLRDVVLEAQVKLLDQPAARLFEVRLDRRVVEAELFEIGQNREGNLGAPGVGLRLKNRVLVRSQVDCRLLGLDHEPREAVDAEQVIRPTVADPFALDGAHRRFDQHVFLGVRAVLVIGHIPPKGLPEWVDVLLPNDGFTRLRVV